VPFENSPVGRAADLHRSTQRKVPAVVTTSSVSPPILSSLFGYGYRKFAELLCRSMSLIVQPAWAKNRQRGQQHSQS
jgi:hypothetical protein